MTLKLFSLTIVILKKGTLMIKNYIVEIKKNKEAAEKRMALFFKEKVKRDDPESLIDLGVALLILISLNFVIIKFDLLSWYIFCIILIFSVIFYVKLHTYCILQRNRFISFRERFESKDNEYENKIKELESDLLSTISKINISDALDELNREEKQFFFRYVDKNEHLIPDSFFLKNKKYVTTKTI